MTLRVEYNQQAKRIARKVKAVGISGLNMQFSPQECLALAKVLEVTSSEDRYVKTLEARVAELNERLAQTKEYGSALWVWAKIGQAFTIGFVIAAIQYTWG